MIELQPLSTTAASLSRLQDAMQADSKTLQYTQPVRTLLNNWQTAARVGAIQAMVAVEADQALGLVILRPDIAHQLGRINVLYAIPAVAQHVTPLLVSYAVETIWAAPTLQHLRSTLLIDQPGVQAAFEARGVQCIERQEMRISDLSAYLQPITPPPGFRFAPISDDLIEAAARLTVESYQGTLDDLLFADLQTVTGMAAFIREIMTDSHEAFDVEGSVLAYNDEPTPDQLAGLILCSLTQSKLGFILDINVAREYRKRGLARAMLSNALHSFAQKGAVGVQLWVTISNPARLLYESLGFSAYAPLWVYVGTRSSGVMHP